MEKRCTKCGQTKDVNKFPKNKNMKDGYEGRCKDCRNVELKEWRKNNISTIRQQQQKYNHSEKGRNTHVDWIQNHKIYIAIKKHAYKISNAEKINAHTIVNHTIRAGKLPQINTLTCHRCHVNQAEHYHHPDYSKPLEVIPLCRQCHINIHNQS